MKKAVKQESPGRKGRSKTNPRESLPAERERGARERLIQEAMRLFAEKGYQGASTREIASAAGINLSLIAYYFGGKLGLYREIWRLYAEWNRRAVEEALSAFAEKGTPELSREGVKTVLATLVDSLIEQGNRWPWMITILRRELLDGGVRAGELFRGVFDESAAQIFAFLESAREVGILRRECNVASLLLTVMGAVESHFSARSSGQTWVNRALHPEQESVKFREFLCKLLFEGVMVPQQALI